ncbi:proline-rich protein 23D1-like [Tupaia chinensis]|uniref:proline-rich protein 23D1-like n=1 Tax=Tupaia chinensis TaxID=246437 RepID=UPI0007042360|nr:proline-rich protein 23D1-like [Tupaia chinensis]
MYGFRRPRSPSGFLLDQMDKKTGDGRFVEGVCAREAERSNYQSNAMKRCKVEQVPGTGVQPERMHERPVSDHRLPQEPPQVGQNPKPQMIVVVLEAAMVLKLRLGAEVLVLDPKRALQFTLNDVLVVVVTEYILRSSQGLRFPTKARWLLLNDPEITWVIDLEDGSLTFQGAKNIWGPQAEEAGEDSQCRQLMMGSQAKQENGIRLSAANILFLTARPRATSPRGISEVQKLSPRYRPLPEEFSLNLHGLQPLPGSALRPLPPSPSPGPRTCHKVGPHPPSKARRQLFYV